MEKKIRQIRNDLRELRKLTHSIEAALKVKENHERRKAFLLSLEQTPEIAAEVERIDGVLNALNVQELIAKASANELKYMAAIGTLNALERVIVLEGYINGIPFWKIGKKIGYSEDGIKKKAKQALERLAVIV